MKNYNIAGFIFAMLGLSQLVSPALASDYTFDYDENGNDVVVRLYHEFSMIRAVDRGPSWTLYSNGKLKIHRPAFLVNSGDYATLLSPQERRQFIAQLASFGVMSFDQIANEQAFATAEANFDANARALNQPYAVRTDGDWIRLETRVFELGTTPSMEFGPAVDNVIDWNNLQFEAQKFPQLTAIADLAAAERYIMQFAAEQIPLEKDGDEYQD